MKSRFLTRMNWKIIGSLIWLGLTFSLTSWWFLFVMESVTHPHVGDLDPDLLSRRHRMIFWEGGSLLFIVLLGGASLVWFSYRDSQRAARLREFFSHFAHDLKTSMARVQLRAEVLQESLGAHQDDGAPPRLLLNDVKRLHLQLENALLITHLDDHLLFENMDLATMVSEVGREYEEIQTVVEGAESVHADSRALRSLLRNIFQNSILHGSATKMDVMIKPLGPHQVQVVLKDNGKGSANDIKTLGKSLTPLGKAPSSYGIGLYLSSRLVRQMRGSMRFESSSRGFTVHLELPRSLRGAGR